MESVMKLEKEEDGRGSRARGAVLTLTLCCWGAKDQGRVVETSELNLILIILFPDTGFAFSSYLTCSHSMTRVSRVP